MGTWRSYVCLPEDVGQAPADCLRRAPAGGWICHEIPVRMPAELADEVRTAGIVASVWDSDACVAMGVAAGEPRWSWTFGELPFPATDTGDEAARQEYEDSLPDRARATAEAIAAWAAEVTLPELGVAEVTEVLDSGYPSAEHGLFALLAAVGLPLGPFTELADTAPRPAVALPKVERPEGVWAIEIDRSSLAWRDFVHEHELEDWGDPQAVVVVDDRVFLATDPPLLVTALNPRSTLDDLAARIGGFRERVRVPVRYSEIREAAAWAREHVGRPGAPPRTPRPMMADEIPASRRTPRTDGWERHNLFTPFTRAPEPSVVARLTAPTDLSDQLDALAVWLDAVRAALFVPVMASYEPTRLRTSIDPHEQIGGQPYGLLVHASGTTHKHRYTFGAGDDRGWQRKLNQLRRGELIALDLRATSINGAGRGSRHGIHLNVELGDGPPAAQHDDPDETRSELAITATQFLLQRADPPVHPQQVADLMSQAAHTFHATDGFAYADIYDTYSLSQGAEPDDPLWRH